MKPKKWIVLYYFQDEIRDIHVFSDEDKAKEYAKKSKWYEIYEVTEDDETYNDGDF